ncbi:MAG TPA: DUF1559 domain-containing protein [Pirellulaceae bacterium]|nr:DUF1559 domain-containing protein [Pirellulaceae bacterium]
MKIDQRCCPCIVRAPRGVTIIELMVVLAIISVLIALLLPAVQYSREASRRAHCQNNLRQIGVATLLHESTLRRFPAGGWGGKWVGDPDRGSDRHQPGSWCFAILPYLEQDAIRTRGQGLTGVARDSAISEVVGTPILVYQCPSRRPARAYPIVYLPAAMPINSGIVSRAARSDYAANAGGQLRCEIEGFSGPPSLSYGDSPNYPWPQVTDHTGICFLRSEIASAEVTGGMSNTYLVGEKHLYVHEYHTGKDHGDDWSLYAGYQDDNHRSCACSPIRDTKADPLPGPANCRFGSAHPGSWNVVYCDGSVHSLSYDLELTVHTAYGDRH